MARIVVCGYMIRHPVAGNLLAFFHYLLGLHRLGHQVTYLEDSGGWPDPCYDPRTGEYGSDPRPGLRIVEALFAAHGLGAPVCYVDRDGSAVTGTSWQEVKQALRDADLLLNIGGVCWLPEFELCTRRALIDMDPLFTQVGRFGAEGMDRYQAYFSYGANIGAPGCSIPLAGVDWRPTVPPVVTELWASGPPQPGAPFTTVANWSAYGAITYRGERYGQKDEEFLRLVDLPGRVSQPLEVALAGAPAEIVRRLRAAGWSIVSPARVSADLQEYSAYVRRSRGEFSVAKQAYVKTRSGWFSDRSVCYLAAGRPAILQDTGFSEWLPTGRGVLAFSTVEQAAERLEQVDADYEAHCRAARDLAERVFSYQAVLPPLLEVTLPGGRTRSVAVRGAP